MISMICINDKGDLEVIVASRIGYDRAEKRFWFEMIGRPDVFYYENVESEMAAAAIKMALKQNGANLKAFGTYKVKRFAPPAPPAPLHKGTCPKAAEKAAENMSDTKAMPNLNNTVASKPVPPKKEAPKAATKPVEKRSPAAKNSFMDKVTNVLGEGVKKVKDIAQEVAVVAEEEDKKDKERAAVRKAEWDKKRSDMEQAIEERRARRAAARAAEAEADDEDEDDEIRSEFDEIARGVAAAVEQEVDNVSPVQNVSAAPAPVPVEPTDIDVEAEIAAIMAEKGTTPATEDELKEITQLNLDFGSLDDVVDDLLDD